MRWIWPLLILALGGSSARGERLLVPDAPPFATPPAWTPLGEPGEVRDYVRIDGGASFTVLGPGVVECVARGYAESKAAAPESLEVVLEDLAGYPPQRWVKAVLLAREFAYGDGRPGRFTTPQRCTFAVPSGVHRFRLSGTGAPGEPVYARLTFDGPPSEEEEEAARLAAIAPLPAAEDSRGLPVGIGQVEKFTDYYRIDQGARLRLEGPGLLRLFVRARVRPGHEEPGRVTVILDGLAGLGPQRWEEPLESSPRDIFADDLRGWPTRAVKVLCALPPGRHALTLRAETPGGDPVFASFGYQGPPPKPNPWSLSGDVTLECIYDDNIARFSEATLEELRSGASPHEFGIETEDDLILHPALAAELRHDELLFGKATRLRVRVQRWEYLRNALKTNDEIQLRFRQHARSSDYFEASYTYAPDGYVKELADRPPYTSFSVPREYLHFEVTRNDFDFSYYCRARAWLGLRANAGRTLRFYNRPFLENDIWEWSTGLYADLFIGRFALRPEYGYVDAKARGVDQVGETIETTDNDGDGSYEKDTYKFRVLYRPGRASSLPETAGDDLGARLLGVARRAGALADRGLTMLRTASCEVQLSYTRQFYTSTKPLFVDPLHVGRLDESRQIQLVWNSRPVYKRLSLEAGWRYTERTAKAPAGQIGEDDPSEEKDYTGARYWIAVAVPLR